MGTVLQQHSCPALRLADLTIFSHGPKFRRSQLRWTWPYSSTPFNSLRICMSRGKRISALCNLKGIFHLGPLHCLVPRKDQREGGQRPHEGGGPPGLPRFLGTGLACVLSFAVAFSSSAGAGPSTSAQCSNTMMCHVTC
jgi:hypothetical protein